MKVKLLRVKVKLYISTKKGNKDKGYYGAIHHLVDVIPIKKFPLSYTIDMRDTREA